MIEWTPERISRIKLSFKFSSNMTETLLVSAAEEIERLQAENRKLRGVCAEAYQFAGAYGAPEAVLDNLSDAANGYPLRHETFLPVEGGRRERSEQDIDRLRGVWMDHAPTCMSHRLGRNYECDCPRFT